MFPQDYGPNYLLDHTATIQIPRKVENLTLHTPNQSTFLILVSILKDLLYHVIGKWVLHQRQCVGKDFAKNTSLLVAISIFKLRLYESRAVLVSTEFDDVLMDVLISINMMFPARLHKTYAEFPSSSGSVGPEFF